MEAETTGLVIDWHLLVLQAGNFLFLLAILTWLVWKPFVAMIDKRRREIAEGLAAAAAQKAAAAEADQARKALLAETRKEADVILSETRAQIAAEQADARANLEKERDRLHKEAVAIAEAEKARIEKELRQSTSQLITLAVSRLLDQDMDKEMGWKDKLEKSLKEIA